MNRILEEVISGTPPSKSNGYKIITFNGHASLAKSKALKDYEKLFFIQCKNRNADIEGYFEFEMKAFLPSQRQDLDGLFKVVLDSLQVCKVIRNDNKCVKITAEKFLDKANPRVELKIIEL